MSPRARRFLVIAFILLLVLLVLLFARCSCTTVAQTASASKAQPGAVTPAIDAPAPATPRAAERLTPAALQAPLRIAAGARFSASWSGPNNDGDYLTIVRPDAADSTYENYRETKLGPTLELTAPIETGNWEVRYVAARSKTVLGRTALIVDPIQAALTAPDEVVLGSSFAVSWVGPSNAGDFVTVVPTGAPDAAYESYADTAKGASVTLVAPTKAGTAEVRYVSGQGKKVLARRSIAVVAPETSLAAPTEVVAGSMFAVTWSGPNNARDYITIVPRGTPDGEYRNYVDTAKGSPLQLRALVDEGEAEIRYMTGTQARVLARRPITVKSPDISLEAAAEVPAGSAVTIAWNGPKNSGDYLTIVPRGTPDGQYGKYADVAKGSPVTIAAPVQPGPAEIRYVSGQGAKVFARRPITISDAR